MTELIKIKPAGKNLLRNPDTMAHILPGGEHVERNSYWLRRIADGDAVEVKDDAKADGGKQ